MGDGEFLHAVATEANANGAQVTLWGVELALDTYRATLQRGVVDTDHAILSDFLAVRPFPVDVAIGNPPYVRLRHLPPADAERARTVAAPILQEAMDPGGSIWMPFVLHAAEFLAPGGRLAFVLPHDLTYVRYARPLWRHLAASFGDLRIVRVHERVFPEILQEVVLLLADQRGGTTRGVTFEAFEHRRDLEFGTPISRTTIAIDRITQGERPFLEALLPTDLRQLLQTTVASGTRPVRDLATFNIGYVCGDKRFFHPEPATVEKYELPVSSLVPALTSSRRIRATGLFTSQLPPEGVDNLFLPPMNEEALTLGEHRYITKGRRDGVHKGYKASVRKPWYVTPGVKRPDLIVPVFADRPLLLINDGEYAASNSLLTGYLTPQGSVDAIAASWYTSLTLLQVELNVHSLGGGVMIFVPQEAGSIRLTRGVSARGQLRHVDKFLRAGKIEEAYRAGDSLVLSKQLRLTTEQVELVRGGVDILRHWRTARSRPGDVG
jgi:hypothetical protein